MILGAARSMIKATSLSMKMDVPQKLAALAPAMLAAPAFASDVRLQ